MAISTEELEYLLRPPQNKEAAEPSQTQNDEDTEEERRSPEEDDTHSPEIWVRFKNTNTLTGELIRLPLHLI